MPPAHATAPAHASVALPALFGEDFELIVESIPQMVWVTDTDGLLEYVNSAFAEYVGVPPQQTYGWGWLDVVHPEDVARTRSAWEHSVSSNERYEIEYRARRADAKHRWMAVNSRPVRGPDGKVVKWIGTWTDIDDEKHLEEHLREAHNQTAESLALLEALHGTAPVGFGFGDTEYRVLRANETLAGLTGRSAADCLGRTVGEIVPQLWTMLEPLYKSVLETGEAQVNLETVGRTDGTPGERRTWLTSLYPVHAHEDLLGIGVVVVDITQRQLAEDFRSIVLENMAEGVYTLDGDGRVTLVNAAASGMLGWTEEELKGKSAHALIHHQHADGTKFHEWECDLLKVRTEGRAIGVADDVFTRKDGSLLPVSYSAAPLLSGETVRGVVVVFRDTSAEAGERTRIQSELDALAWVGRVRDALDEDRLVLYSQPIVAVADGKKVSDELLLRMVEPNGNVIAPGAFLPVAEKYGLIAEIDRWVIKQAIRLVATGRPVQVNLSAESIAKSILERDLLWLIERELKATGADPAKLVFELTETAVIADIEAGGIFARRLAAIGCGLALDDFGTGFGSFTYLKSLPLQYLKIDIEFVRDLVSNKANQHLVTAIVGLARDFGYCTIAEGVEDAETFALLGEYGVDLAQGFHLGRPAPIPMHGPESSAS